METIIVRMPKYFNILWVLSMVMHMGAHTWRHIYAYPHMQTHAHTGTHKHIAWGIAEKFQLKSRKTMTHGQEIDAYNKSTAHIIIL